MKAQHRYVLLLLGLGILGFGCSASENEDRDSDEVETAVGGEPEEVEASAPNPTPGAEEVSEPSESGEEVEEGAKDIVSEYPLVEMTTNKGVIRLEVYPGKAPKTVDNFLQYVRDGFYDGTIFHRVVPGFVIQGGGFTPDMQEKDTRAPIENEADNGLKNLRGAICMARTTDPHSATSQFFINTVDNAALDFRDATHFGYAVFGKINPWNGYR